MTQLYWAGLRGTSDSLLLRHIEGIMGSCGRRGWEEGGMCDIPSLLLVEVSRTVGDLLVLVAGEAVAGLLLDEVECCNTQLA